MGNGSLRHNAGGVTMRLTPVDILVKKRTKVIAAIIASFGSVVSCVVCTTIYFSATVAGILIPLAVLVTLAGVIGVLTVACINDLIRSISGGRVRNHGRLHDSDMVGQSPTIPLDAQTQGSSLELDDRSSEEEQGHARSEVISSNISKDDVVPESIGEPTFRFLSSSGGSVEEMSSEVFAPIGKKLR
ncbi:MAG: hypothetical protein ACTJLK_00800 [Anaplasma sp.]